jgi:tRNA (cytidine32/uridine32-2'-O)-methyltransferase
MLRIFLSYWLSQRIPGNIGATARAMANMGVTDLRLVLPGEHLNDVATQRAAHGVEVLKNASVYDHVTDALHDLQWVGGTTARNRKGQDRTVMLPDIAQMFSRSSLSNGVVVRARKQRIDQRRISTLHALIHIPTHGDASSLNLSHAVMVTLYELSRHYEKTNQTIVLISETTRATVEEFAGLRQHLESVLIQTEFLKTHQETGIMKRFDDFFARAQPTDYDIRMWRGMLHRVEITIRRSLANDSKQG